MPVNLMQQFFYSSNYIIYRPISCTYWASPTARLIRLLSRGDNDLITQAAHLDIDRIIIMIRLWYQDGTPWKSKVFGHLQQSELTASSHGHACCMPAPRAHRWEEESRAALGQKREGRRGSSSQSFMQEGWLRQAYIYYICLLYTSDAADE